jgi:DNA-binding Xre family transcriptional regulator
MLLYYAMKPEVTIMTVSYNKLWKLLVDKKMSKADLRKAAGIAPNTMTKLRRDEEVSLAILGKICATLHVNIGDIIDLIQDGTAVEAHHG